MRTKIVSLKPNRYMVIIGKNIKCSYFRGIKNKSTIAKHKSLKNQTKI